MKETEFLRLKRSRLGVDDFEPPESDRTWSIRGGEYRAINSLGDIYSASSWLH